MARSRVWIADIRCPPETEAKIKSRHGVTLDDVKEAILLYACIEARWDEHPEHGERVFARGLTADRREIYAWLSPSIEGEDTWHLRTAWRHE